MKNLKYDKTLNILVAYPYLTPKMKESLLNERQEDYRMIVDSGAFSVYNAGHTVDIDAYCEFIKDMRASFTKLVDLNFVQLDVIFNEEETVKNYEYQTSLGLDVCPVYTRGGSVERLDYLLEQDKYIFVGGVQRGKGNKNFAKMVLEKSQGKKVHYLAFVKPDYVNHYKPYSVDSSSWLAAARYGECLYYKGKGRMSSINKKAFTKKPPENFIEACRKLHIPYDMVKKLRFNESWINDSRDIELNYDPTCGLRSLSQFVTTIHYVYYILEAQNKVGTHIYMAVSNPHDLRRVFQAYEFLKEKGVI